MSGEKENPKILRILTYMCPDHPVELYEVYKELFEAVLGVKCDLKFLTSHVYIDDPFNKDTADIVFMSLISYMKILQHKTQCSCRPISVAPLFELVPSQTEAVSFSDVIISKSKKDQIKKFDDLRGHKWAVVDDKSWVLYELSKMGQNANFFGHIIHTDSEKDAIKSVLDHTSDATSVDSTVLKFHLDKNPEDKDKLHVLCNWGPYAPHPIVISRKLTEEFRVKLENALLSVKQLQPNLASKFKKHGIIGFSQIETEQFDETNHQLKTIEQQHIYPVYY